MGSHKNAKKGGEGERFVIITDGPRASRLEDQFYQGEKTHLEGDNCRPSKGGQGPGEK